MAKTTATTLVVNVDLLEEPMIASDPQYGKKFKPTDLECIKLLNQKNRVNKDYCNEAITMKDVYTETPADLLNNGDTVNYFFTKSSIQTRFHRSLGQNGFWKQKSLASLIEENNQILGYKVRLDYEERDHNMKPTFCIDEFHLDSDNDTVMLVKLSKLGDHQLTNNGWDRYLVVDSNRQIECPDIGLTPHFGKFFNPTEEECVKLLYHKRLVNRNYSNPDIEELDVYSRRPSQLAPIQGVIQYFFSNSTRKSRFNRSVNDADSWARRGNVKSILKNNRTIGFKVELVYRDEDGEFLMEEYRLSTDGVKIVFTFNKVIRTTRVLLTTDQTNIAALDLLLDDGGQNVDEANGDGDNVDEETDGSSSTKKMREV